MWAAGRLKDANLQVLISGIWRKLQLTQIRKQRLSILHLQRAALKKWSLVMRQRTLFAQRHLKM